MSKWICLKPAHAVLIRQAAPASTRKKTAGQQQGARGGRRKEELCNKPARGGSGLKNAELMARMWRQWPGRECDVPPLHPAVRLGLGLRADLEGRRLHAHRRSDDAHVHHDPR